MQNDVSPAWNHSEQSVGSGKGVLVEVGRISVAAASFFSGVWRISAAEARNIVEAGRMSAAVARNSSGSREDNYIISKAFSGSVQDISDIGQKKWW